jgi:NAD(P)H-flavin reductase
VQLYLEDKDGIIDISQIILDNGISSNYFISGPPVMINSFKNILIEKGVPPGKVLTDNWE